jgi:spore cortex formation protein SpoVR/YcgB (stage V sporulation)
MKAAKNDDADVSIMHWDARVLAPWFGNERFVQRLEAFSIRFATDVLAVMRSIALSRWRRNLLRSLSRYMSKTYHQQWTTKPRDRSLHNDWVQDIHAGRDC